MDTDPMRAMVFKSIIVYSLVYCTSWCATADDQDITISTITDDNMDSELSGATVFDNVSYNFTTETPLPGTTVNEYFISSSSSSSSAASRDRMGSVNSHYNHKDKPKSTEEVSVVLHSFHYSVF